jgi:hypothetical protein
MKKVSLLFLLCSSLLTISSQVEIEAPPCFSDDPSFTKKDKKKFIKSLKFLDVLPESFFESQVSIYVINRGFENVSQAAESKNGFSFYNFNNTFNQALEACEMAGLNVSRIMTIHAPFDYIFAGKFIHYDISDEEKERAKKNGDDYLVYITDNVGGQEAAVKMSQIFQKVNPIVKVVNLSDPKEYYTCTLEKLQESEFANKSNSTIKEVVNSIDEKAVYGSMEALPEDLSKGKIYFIQNPILIMPDVNKPDLGCRMTLEFYSGKNDKYSKQNLLAKKILPTSNVKIQIVNEEKGIVIEPKTYVIKYYEKVVMVSNPSNGAIVGQVRPVFYIENVITKQIYLFDGGKNIGDYSKYLKMVVEEINSH